ncbi:MAG: hypothetical protein ACLUSP_00220 [Christensenellales bacterium]
MVFFVPTTSTVKLKAKITEGAATIEKDFDMTSSNTVTVRSAVTIANNLLTRWYGTEITVTANGDGTYAFSGASEAAFAGYLPLYDLEYYATADGGAYATLYPGVKASLTAWFTATPPKNFTRLPGRLTAVTSNASKS